MPGFGRRVVARLVAITITASGCATRTWNPVERSLGESYAVEPQHSVSYRAMASVSDFPRSGVGVELAITRSIEAIWQQDFRVYEKGRAEAKDANLKGTLWLLGGLLAGGLVAYGAVRAGQQGKPIAPWVPPVAGASTFAPLGLTGLGNFLMQAPIRRNVHIDERPESRWTEWAPCGGCTVELVDGAGAVRARGVTEADGTVHVVVAAEQGVPEHARVRVDGGLAEGEVDLRESHAWQRQQARRIQARIDVGEFEAAHAAILVMHGGDLLSTSSDAYCSAVVETLRGMGAELDRQGVQNILSGLDVGRPTCFAAWTVYREAALATLAPEAGRGEFERLDALIATLPADVRGPAVLLRRCATAVADEDPRAALVSLHELEVSDAAVARACAESARPRKEQELRDAIAAEERARRAEVARQEACRAVGVEWRRSITEMLTPGYVVALRQAVLRLRDTIERDAKAEALRGGPTSREEERIQCLAEAGTSADQLLRSLEQARWDDFTIDEDFEGLSDETLDVMADALGIGTTCASEMGRNLKVVSGAIRAHLVADEKWRASECDR